MTHPVKNSSSPSYTDPGRAPMTCPPAKNGGEKNQKSPLGEKTKGLLWDLGQEFKGLLEGRPWQPKRS